MSDCVGTAALHLAVPATINMYLRDYQREGVRFLFRQYANQQGGILGDDMVCLSPFAVIHTMLPYIHHTVEHY